MYTAQKARIIGKAKALTYKYWEYDPSDNKEKMLKIIDTIKLEHPLYEKLLEMLAVVDVTDDIDKQDAWNREGIEFINRMDRWEHENNINDDLNSNDGNYSKKSHSQGDSMNLSNYGIDSANRMHNNEESNDNNNHDLNMDMDL